MHEKSRIPIILTTGFLGSGKTTFLNSLVPRLRSDDQRVAVLLNEIGDTNVDAHLIKERDHLAEVLGGSVFCACVRGELIAAMQHIAADVCPDVLVMEATGVADPGAGLPINVDQIEQEYRLAHTVCLVAADRFFKLALTMAAARRQVQVANLVVVTGTDRASTEDVEKTLAAVNRLNNRCTVVQAPYARLPEAVWHGLEQIVEGVAGAFPEAVLEVGTPEQDVRDVYSTLIVPVDALPAGGAATILGLLPSGTERAKGFVVVEGVTKLFQYANSQVQLEPAPDHVESGWILAIGRYPQVLSLG